MLTSLLTAHLWRYAGVDIPEAGAGVGVLLASAIGILVGTIWELRDRITAISAGFILLSTPFFLELSTSQYAGLPLAVFILSTIALTCLYAERVPDSRATFALAGFMAGCAAWTKNEGIAFMLIASGV